MSGGILIAGARASGKTTYLASLLLGWSRAYQRRKSVRVTPQARDQPALELQAHAVGILAGVPAPATRDTSTYQFRVEMPGSTLFDLGSQVVPLSAIDPPGGGVMPAPGSSLHDAVLDALRRSPWLLTIAAVDGAGAAGFTAGFEALLAAARRVRCDGRKEPPFERVAVALTRCDTIRGGATRRTDLLACRPRDVFVERYGQTALQRLVDAAPGDSLSFYAVSAFGFDATTGDAVTAEMLEGWNAADQAGAGWSPFGIYAPLEFLVRGYVTWSEEDS